MKIKDPPRLILLAVLCFVVPFSITMVAIFQPYVDPKQLFLDPLVAAKYADPEQCCSPYLGAISNLGVLMWAFAAAIALFSAYLAYSFKLSSKYFFFLLNSGIISFVLMADDLFLGHEEIFPRFLGIQEKYLMLIYGLGILGYVVFSYRTILKLDFLLMAISFLFFFFSVAIDMGYSGSSPLLKPFGEDINKLIGISFWTVFLIRSSWLICFVRVNRFNKN